MITLSYPFVIWIGTPALLLYAWILKHRTPMNAYRFAPTILFTSTERHRTSITTKLRMFMRFLTLLTLLIASSRPRSPLPNTQLPINGIGIMMLLDVSKSMEFFDDLQDRTSRFESAQREADAFIQRRTHDNIGLIIFGAVAATRCPLTTDHTMLRTILKDTTVGVIADQETVIADAIAMGVRRLQNSSAKTNIIVLLTDGEPSPADAQRIPEAISLAQKANIKIYTIGIGNPDGGYFEHPALGLVRIPPSSGWQLLEVIAAQTGGVHFAAHNQAQLQDIYTKIDSLERTDLEKPIYAAWYEWSVPLMILAGCLFFMECILAWWHLTL